MYRIASVVAALVVSAGPASASAEIWRYQFQPGHTYRYNYQERTTLKMSVPMMGAQTQHLAMDTDFSLHIEKRLPDGRYDAVIDVDAVRFTQANGQTLTLSNIPRQMRTVRATISPRGQFDFYQRVVVQVEDNGAYAMGFIDARHGRATASATAGGETVTASAQIDPRTGRVSATITHEKAAPRTHAEVRQEKAQPLEILPSRILALMGLPEGAVAPGASFELDTPMMKVHEEVLAPQPCGKSSCGRIQLTAKSNASTGTAEATAVSAVPPGQDAQMQADMQTANANMAAAMAGMPGMGAPGMGTPPATAGAAGPSMTSDVSAVMSFDPARGNLASVTGTGSSSMHGPGMSMESQGKFALSAR